MNDQQLTTLFAESDLSGQPDLPPDYLPGLLAKARRSARQRRLVTMLAAAAAVLVVLGLTAVIRPHATGLPPADRTPGTPTIPDRIAPYSRLTSDVSASPPGRALMIYEYGNGELFNEWQSLALSADGDVYRQLGAVADGRQWLLSPDGRTVILAESRRATAALTLLDLTAAKVREVPLPGPMGVVLLAVSADGRKVAYSTAPLPEDMSADNSIEFQNAQLGKLSIVDLSTGEVMAVPDFQPVVAAAFAPDGRRLAFQAKRKIWIMTLGGRLETPVDVPEGWGMAPQNAWSADGTRLATTQWRTELGQTRDDTTLSVYVVDSWYGYGVVDLATGRHRKINADTDTFLGWRDRDHTIVFTPSGADNGGDEIAEVTLDGGTRTSLTRFDAGKSCELGTQTCQTYRLTVAAGLLPDLTTRPAGTAHRGPWPTWVWLVVGIPLLLVALITGFVVQRIRRARRRRAQVPPTQLPPTQLPPTQLPPTPEPPASHPSAE
ncbi:hypothetical protein HDA40_002936 [Hamadaea flava]|uniref:TolB family protein n=1 Tax=Hamadaea flava TaxID=1742688 RepID=A0ABV8M1H6_9ACTN|nr:hypothetical protein [Hamadaea flava]MCP2324429.1 hypothetical protein [Hamadaea flava]